MQEAQLATRCYAIDTWEGDDHSGYYGEHIYQDIKAWHDARFTAFSQLRRTTFDQAVAAQAADLLAVAVNETNTGDRYVTIHARTFALGRY